jgi:hypothetical protein
MIIDSLDNNVKNVLFESEWNQNETKNVCGIIKKLSKYYPSAANNPFLKEFLELFYGFKIRYDSYSPESDKEDFMEIDPMIVSRLPYDDYEKIVKEHLVPIGVGYGGYLTYLISETGKIYGGYDDIFYKIGETVNDAFENIFFRKKFEKVSIQ